MYFKKIQKGLGISSANLRGIQLKKKCTKNLQVFHRVISFIIDDEIHFSVYYSLGSGSDMATFYQRAGVPSIDMWFTYDEVSASVLLKTLICHLQN